jgi:hypothetical protein
VWHLWVTHTVQYDNGDNSTSSMSMPLCHCRMNERHRFAAVTYCPIIRIQLRSTHASANYSQGWEPLPWTPPGLSTLGVLSDSPSTPLLLQSPALTDSSSRDTKCQALSMSHLVNLCPWALTIRWHLLHLISPLSHILT